MESNRGRKKKEVNYNSPFAARLRDLLAKTKTTQPVLAEAIGVSRQAIGQWKDGNTLPDIMALSKIADYFNVSADYLLGLSDISSNDKDLKEVCAYTGLSEKIIKTLADSKNETATNEPITIPLPLNYCKEIKIQDRITLRDVFNIFFADGGYNVFSGRNEWLDLFKLISYYCYYAEFHNSLILKNIISDYFNTILPEYRSSDKPISVDFTNNSFSYNKLDDYPF